MVKRFQHLGEDWEVTGLGSGHGVGFGFIPKITNWSAEFRSLSNPNHGPYRGRIGSVDPATVSDEELQRALEVPFLVDVLRNSTEPWRTVQSLSEETGLLPERVARILEWESDDVVEGDFPDKQGRVLYAARDRYAEETPFMKRYLDVLKTSST